MVLRRLKWAASQIAVRPSAHLPEPGEMLIGLADLSAGWRLRDQRRWRTGHLSKQPWAARARELGSVTAWRTFANRSQGRWLWAEAIPLASTEDAECALQEVWNHFFWNPLVKLVATEEGPPLTIPADQVRTRQQHGRGPRGPSVTRLVAWSYRGVVSVLAASSLDEPWAWQDLAGLATSQSHRINAVVGGVD